MKSKPIRIMVRVTPELKQKLDEYVAMVPGGRGDVMRDALQQHLARNLPIMRSINEHNRVAAQPP